jgi:hypothetical protein
VLIVSFLIEPPTPPRRGFLLGAPATAIGVGDYDGPDPATESVIRDLTALVEAVGEPQALA